MEKLELKHLAHYLPYNLEGLIYYSDTDFETTKLCITDGLNNEADIASWLLGTYKVKPILRPLSDLTKEIEVNGEKFIPIEILFGTAIYLQGYSHYINSFNDAFELTMSKKNRNTLYANFKQYQKLFEWHFDVFGLIEKGLAVDINTL